MLTYRKYISASSSAMTSKLSMSIFFLVATNSAAPKSKTIMSRMAENSDSLVQKNTAYHASDKIYIAIVRENATTKRFPLPQMHASDFKIIPMIAPISAYIKRHRTNAPLRLTLTFCNLYDCRINHVLPPFTHKRTPPRDVIKENRTITEIFDRRNAASRRNLLNKKSPHNNVCGDFCFINDY